MLLSRLCPSEQPLVMLALDVVISASVQQVPVRIECSLMYVCYFRSERRLRNHALLTMAIEDASIEDFRLVSIYL